MTVWFLSGCNFLSESFVFCNTWRRSWSLIPRKYCSSNNACESKKYKYHPEVERQINAQIGYEQDASQKYLAIAGYFGNVNIARNGCYNFFIEMHKEEVQHARKLIKYQLFRGGNVVLNQINSPCLQGNGILQQFEQALEIEHNITAKLEHLIELAGKHKDYPCADYIIQEFMKDQLNSIDLLCRIITQIQNLGNNEVNMLIFDLELEKQFSKAVL